MEERTLPLVADRPGDLAELMTWFEDREDAIRWGGPRITWPLEAATFHEVVFPGYVHTRVSRDPSGHLVAFGQFYRKFDRCHLARIGIAPSRRGQGLGTTLVRAVMREGLRHLGVFGCSLYVLESNRPAIACYQRCGFVFAEDPEPVPALPDCLFMVAEGAVIDALLAETPGAGG